MKTHFRIFLLLIGFLIARPAFSQDKKRIEYLRDSLKLSGLSNQTRSWLLSKLAWDVSYYDLNEGLKYGEEAIKIAKAGNYIMELAHACNVVGTIYMDLGNYPIAVDYLLQAANQYHSINNEKGVAIVYGNLGIIYTRRGEYRKALDAYFYDYRFAGAHRTPGYTHSLLNIASIYNQLDMPDSSKYYLDILLERSDLDSLQKSSAYNSMANMLMDKGDYKAARDYVLRAIACIQDSTQKYYLAEHYMVLCAVETKLKNFPAAAKAGNTALSYSKEVGVKDFEKNSYEVLENMYEEQKDFGKALLCMKQYNLIKDSLINTENMQAMRFMETRFETEKKEKEIELLNKDKKLQEEKINKDNILIKAFLFGGIILVIALGLSIYAFINKRKANRKLVMLNNEVHQQKNQLLEKNQAITDSIQYASRIQSALLTSEHYIKKFIPEFFIINQPKDIVSGDFYWAYHQDSRMYFMCADCTGHGVPGAFMSLLGINFLNEIVIEKRITTPDKVLNELRREIILSLNQQGNTETKDGMDCSFCSIDLAQMSIEIAAANNPVWIIRPPLGGLQQDEKGNFKLAPGFKITEIKPDKMPVGKSPKDTVAFTYKNYQLKKGDCVYMFSDGYADQFGGPRGKKLKYKLFKETILKNCHLPMDEQKAALKKCFADWKANHEQVDDVLVLGIKV